MTKCCEHCEILFQLRNERLLRLLNTKAKLFARLKVHFELVFSLLELLKRFATTNFQKLLNFFLVLCKFLKFAPI